jgi:hypothetical protein
LPSHAARLSFGFVALVFPYNTKAVKTTIGIITHGMIYMQIHELFLPGVFPVDFEWYWVADFSRF